MSAPDKPLLDSYRRHRAQLPPFQNLYPYAMGRVEQCLKDTSVRPARRVALALQQIAALDIVEAEAPKVEVHQ